MNISQEFHPARGARFPVRVGVLKYQVTLVGRGPRKNENPILYSVPFHSFSTRYNEDLSACLAGGGNELFLLLLIEFLSQGNECCMKICIKPMANTRLPVLVPQARACFPGSLQAFPIRPGK